MDEADIVNVHGKVDIVCKGEKINNESIHNSSKIYLKIISTYPLKPLTINVWSKYYSICVCVCVCMCVRERQRDREISSVGVREI